MSKREFVLQMLILNVLIVFALSFGINKRAAQVGHTVHDVLNACTPTPTYEDKWNDYKKDIDESVKNTPTREFTDAFFRAINLLREKDKAEAVINTKILAHQKPTEADFDRYFALKKAYKDAEAKELDPSIDTKNMGNP